MLYPHPAVRPRGLVPTCRRARGWPHSLGEAAPGADLGGSSKYSNDNFED